MARPLLRYAAVVLGTVVVTALVCRTAWTQVSRTENAPIPFAPPAASVTVAQPLPVPPSHPLPVKPEAGMSLDKMLNTLADVRSQKKSLTETEKSLVKNIRKKLEEQIRQAAEHGVTVSPAAPEGRPAVIPGGFIHPATGPAPLTAPYPPSS